jgi:hypothetical protein
MNETPRQSLFVSYAAADAAWVRGSLLPGIGRTPNEVRTHENLTPGQSRVDAFARAVEESDYTLVVLTPAYLVDPWGRVAIDFASHLSVERRRGALIPILVKETEALDLQLRSLVELDFTTRPKADVAITRLRELIAQPPPTVERIDCPYPGLRPFGERDSTHFFGREVEARELLARLRGHRFLAVIGPSGSGKSSLVFAGLVPLLRESRLFGEGAWTALSMRPGIAPGSAQTTVIGSKSDPPESGPMFRDLVATPPQGKFLLVVDQFEELFTAAGEHPEDAAAAASQFQETVRDLAKRDTCHVVITARADFYPDLMTSPLWREISDHRVEILPLGPDGLREAISRPAARVGVYIEEALVERLVADAANEPGALPLMQEALVFLWEELQGRYIGIEQYEVLAGQGEAGAGRRTGLQVAMARHADNVFHELETEEERAIARRIFLRLVQFGEGRADTRRQQRLADLRSVSDDPDLFNRTLDHLVKNRLLIRSGSAQGGPDAR